jgi:hypothetical protein
MPLPIANTFQINNGSGATSLIVEPDGLVVIPSLALIDEKTGNKWLIRVDDGKLIIEPVEIEDKRDHKIKSILDDNI